MRSHLAIISSLVLCASISLSNPGAWQSDSRFSILQTIELTAHFESPIGADSMQSGIIYLGPTIVSVLSPSDESSTNFGLELGGEIRKYFLRPVSGTFMGAYFGWGATWMEDEDDVYVISAGVKFGWRFPVLSSVINLDLEPYIAIGIKLLSSEEERGNFDGALYLGLKTDIF